MQLTWSTKKANMKTMFSIVFHHPNFCSLSHTHPAVPGLARPRNWGHGTWAENPWSSSWVKPPSNSFAETDQQSDDEQEAYEEDEEGEEETELSVEFEIDMTEMEITEDLRKYFAKTERHRRERGEYAIQGEGNSHFVPSLTFSEIVCNNMSGKAKQDYLKAVL